MPLIEVLSLPYDDPAVIVEVQKRCRHYYHNYPCIYPRCNCVNIPFVVRAKLWAKRKLDSLDHPAVNVAMQVPTANQKKETKPMNEEAIAVLKHKIQETEAEARKWDAYVKDHQQDVEKGKLLVQQCHDIIAKYRSAITLLAHLNITKD